jgi:hypothetical protein
MKRLTWVRLIPVTGIVILVAATMAAQSGATIVGAVYMSDETQPVAGARVSLREYPVWGGALGRIVRTSTTASDGTFHFVSVQPGPGYAVVIERTGQASMMGAINDIRDGESLRLTGIRYPCSDINFREMRSDTGVLFRFPPRAFHHWFFICE